VYLSKISPPQQIKIGVRIQNKYLLVFINLVAYDFFCSVAIKKHGKLINLQKAYQNRTSDLVWRACNDPLTPY